VRNVENPKGSGHAVVFGRPTVRKAEFPGGTGMPKKRMPVAERQRENGTDDRPLPAVVPHNRPDTGPGAWAWKSADVGR
jgi:hypothetical protein